MKLVASLAALGLAAASLVAQSPLTTIFTGVNNFGVSGAMAFTMTVNVPAITVNRIDINSVTAAGTHARLRVWQTNTGFPSFSGSEAQPNNWTLLAQGSVITAGVGLPTICCFDTPFTLTSAMGPRGYAVELIGAVCAYTTGTGANQNYNNAELSLAAGAGLVGSNVAEQDSSGSVPVLPPFQGVFNPFNPRVFNGSIHYAVGTSAPLCTFSHAVGQRCGGNFSSWYDLYNRTADAGAALPNRLITMVPNGLGQYTVVTGTSPGLIPFAGHAALAGWASTIAGAVATDDGEVVVPLTTPFPYPGGVANSLVVHNGGMISVASNMAFLDTQLWLGNSFDDYAPRVPALLDAPNTAWYAWHDMDITTTGAVRFAEVGTQAIFTWDTVPNFGSAGTQTFQFTFDSATGVVTMAFQSVDPVGAPNVLYIGNAWLVGYSAGGTGLRPNVERNVATDFVYDTSLAENAAVTLTAAPRPVFGQVVNYSVDNLAGLPLGFLYFSVANPFNPGLPLSVLGVGKPDCLLNFDLGASIGPFNFTAPGVALSLDTNTVVPSVLGLDFWGQALVFDLLGVDLLASLSTSNALHQRIELN